MRWFWLDRFTEFTSGVRATGVKAVALSEEYLHDHWPGYPVMPNSLIAEGMAQTSGLLVSEIYRFSELVVLAKFAKCAFDGEVRPGDVITYRADIVQAKDAGSLEFDFVQAGAASQGRFRQFTTELQYDEQQLAASRLEVTVQIASLDTQDKDRDDTLKSAELLDAGKFPTAQYHATSFARRGNGVEAVGKLTLHGVTRTLRIPLTIRKAADGVEISGEATIKRLDYGVGQGDWSSTEWVGDEVKLQYRVPLTRAK